MTVVRDRYMLPLAIFIVCVHFITCPLYATISKTLVCVFRLLWSQVEELHKAKEQLMLSSEAPRAEEQEQPEEEEEELDEEQEIEEFLDWRTKKAWK